MSLALGLEPDPKLVKEVAEYRQMLADIKTSKVDISEIFEEMSSIKKETKNEVIKQPVEIPKPPSIDDLEFMLEEEEVEEAVEEAKEILEESLSAPLPPSLDDLVKELNIDLEPPKSLIERVSKHISDEVKFENNSFLKEQEDDSPKSLRELKNKVKYLEQWISRIAATGPGSGEVNLLRLDDVDTTNLGDSKYLRYNASNAKLEFATVSGGGGAVDSVNGLTGEVVLTTANVAESGNLYFSNTRVVEALTAGTNISIESNGLISANVSGGGSVDLTSVSSNVIPATDQIYNLGSSDKRWGTLFLANNTIDLGGSLISSDGTGTIVISGTGAVLPAGSKVNLGAKETQIALVSNTGAITTVVPFYTQTSGLNTIATNFEFGANPDDYVFTNFTLSAGTSLQQASVAQFYF